MLRSSSSRHVSRAWKMTWREISLVVPRVRLFWLRRCFHSHTLFMPRLLLIYQRWSFWYDESVWYDSGWGIRPSRMLIVIATEVVLNDFASGGQKFQFNYFLFFRVHRTQRTWNIKFNWHGKVVFMRIFLFHIFKQAMMKFWAFHFEEISFNCNVPSAEKNIAQKCSEN